MSMGMSRATIDSSDPLRETYRQLEQAEALRLQGQLDRAGAICEALVGRYPDYFGALHTLGLIYADKEQYPQALGCFVRATMLNPRSWKTLTALSLVYLELGAPEMAAQTLEQATGIKPEDPGIFLSLGQVYYQEREYELACESYRRAYELDRALDAAGVGLARSCIDLGRYAEAAEVLEDIIRQGTHSLTAINLLRDLPASFVVADALAELERIKRNKDEDAAEFDSSVAFVRAAALDRAGRHAEAWKALVPANQRIYLAKQEDARHETETQRANLAQLRGKRVKISGNNDTSAQTISLFILGPSRSGKTTMETLVAALDGVKRGYENPIVENAVRRTFQAAGLLTARLFEILSPSLDATCCEIYLEELARRAGSAKVFTNTHPGRIHDAARVAAAFPNVRFIFVKRNPDDLMLRIYMRKYARGNSYAYDLRAIRDYITWYHQMIDLLAEKLPDITRVIHYENIVSNPTGALRVAADLCGLATTDKSLPPIGDDRGCAEPYRQFMAAALKG